MLKGYLFRLLQKAIVRLMFWDTLSVAHLMDVQAVTSPTTLAVFLYLSTVFSLMECPSNFSPLKERQTPLFSAAAFLEIRSTSVVASKVPDFTTRENFPNLHSTASLRMRDSIRRDAQCIYRWLASILQVIERQGKAAGFEETKF